RDRGRSAGAGDMHADRRFPPRLRSVRRAQAAGVRGQLTPPMDRTHLDCPFFAAAHRALASTLDGLALPTSDKSTRDGVDAHCRALVRALGNAGVLRYCVPADHGGALPALDSRALCVVRESLGYRDGLADFAFAMQGLGS